MLLMIIWKENFANKLCNNNKRVKKLQDLIKIYKKLKLNLRIKLKEIFM